MLKHFETIEGNFFKKQNDYEESQVDTLTTLSVFVCVCAVNIFALLKLFKLCQLLLLSSKFVYLCL